MPVELRRAKPPDADFLLELLAEDDVRAFLGPRTAASRDAVLEEIEQSARSGSRRASAAS